MQTIFLSKTSFSVVLSSFGHIFAPNPEVAIKEMLCVTKSGGKDRSAL